MSVENPENVRRTVKNAYAEAITRSAGSCCPTSCCGPSAPSAVADQIGYSKEELATVPGQAASSSFGCGNPLAFADVREGQTVVDLGAGAGLDLILAAHAVGSAGKVIGIDMTDAMIESARANIARAGVGNVEVRKGIIEEMPVEDGSADWVISNCVINLSPEKDRVFAEIFRVLKPGGTMQVSDIVVQDLPDWARHRQDLFTSCIAGAVSEEEYVKGLRDAGLEDVEVSEQVIYGATHIRAFLESEELPAVSEDPAGLSPEDAKTIAESLAGKVWSAKIRARKAQAA